MKKVSDRIERLIIRKLDGEITSDEELELDRELLRVPEVRELFESYRVIDELSAEVIAACAGRRRPEKPLLMVPSHHPAAQPGRRGWMLYASALAACLALFIIWRTPKSTPPRVTPDTTELAQSTPAHLSPRSNRVVPRIGGTGGDAGVWHVADRPAQRLDRYTDRNVILVPGRGGEVYLLNVDQVREVRQPTRQNLARFTRDPI